MSDLLFLPCAHRLLERLQAARTASTVCVFFSTDFTILQYSWIHRSGKPLPLRQVSFARLGQIMGGRNGDTTTWNNAPSPPLFFWKTQTVTPCLQEKRTTKTPAAYWKHPLIVEKTWNQPPSSATFSRPRGIGIMVNGRLVCLGSASQLKATHGYGALAFFNYKNATQPEATNQHQLTLFFLLYGLDYPII